MIEPWVRDLVENVMGPSHMEVGKVIYHPHGYRVLVTSGQYWGTHGLSNHWSWRLVDAEGKPYGKTFSGYGW